MTIDEEKQQLRATIRRLSAQLPFRYREAADRAIARHLLALPEYRSAGAVFCFVSAGREIDTRPILEQTLADGKMLCVPLCVADGIMELRAIRDLKELFPGAYGILEPPADSPALSPDQIDLAVIPCVTCSREGRRLGRGGGYYDRFLAHYRGAAVLLCRERLLRQEIPFGVHDYPIPWVLTDAIPAGMTGKRSASHKIVKIFPLSLQHFVGVLPLVPLTGPWNSDKLEKAYIFRKTGSHEGGPLQ